MAENNDDILQLHIHSIPLNLDVDNEKYDEEVESESENEESKGISEQPNNNFLFQSDEPSTSYQIHAQNKSSSKEVALLNDEEIPKEVEVENENELIDLSVDLPPTTLNLLKLNLAYQEVVEQQLELVDKLINENSYKRRILNEEYSRLISNKKTPKIEVAIFNKKLLKDESGSSPPVNIEILNRKSEVGEHFIPNVYCATRWTKPMDTALLAGVKKSALRTVTEPLLAKLSYLKDKYQKSNDKELEKKMENVKKQIKSSSDVSELIREKSRDWDWASICNLDLDGATSATNCELRWKNVCHPVLKKSAWTPKEDEILKSFLKTNTTRDWKKVSDKLPGRTPAQCCKRFQLKFNTNFRRSTWTPEEDEKLTKLVEKFRVGSVIPYTKVALHMESRVASQLIHRWTKTLDPYIKRSRWTPEEDAALIRAVVQFGEKWSVIRDLNLIKGRNDAQLRERYTKCLSGLTRGPWTIEEDTLLEKLVQHYDKKWSIIASHLKPRTDRQCLKRWAIIKGIRKKGNTVVYKKRTRGPMPGLQTIRDKLNVSICAEHKNIKNENGNLTDPSTSEVDASKMKNLINITKRSGRFASMTFHKDFFNNLSKDMSSAEVIKVYTDVLKMRNSVTKQNNQNLKSADIRYELEIDKEIRLLLRQHFRPLKVKSELPTTPMHKHYKCIEDTLNNITPKQIFVNYVQALNIDAERALEAIRIRKMKTRSDAGDVIATDTSLNQPRSSTTFVRNLYLPLCSPNTATVGAYHVLIKDKAKRVKSAKEIIVLGSDPPVTSSTENPTKHKIENLLDNMRSSYQYKVFRSRFNALMTWPTLLGSLIPYQRTPSGNFHVPMYEVSSGKRPHEGKQQHGKLKKAKK